MHKLLIRIGFWNPKPKLSIHKENGPVNHINWIFTWKRLFWYLYLHHLIAYFTSKKKEVHCADESRGAINTLVAGLRIYHTWKYGKKQGYFSCLTNRIAPQRIALESCSNPEKTQQVFESAMKKKLWFWVFCEWCHNQNSFTLF